MCTRPCLSHKEFSLARKDGVILEGLCLHNKGRLSLKLEFRLDLSFTMVSCPTSASRGASPVGRSQRTHFILVRFWIVEPLSLNLTFDDDVVVKVAPLHPSVCRSRPMLDPPLSR
eukprot:6434539-Amphidinium_carterae.1